MSLFSMKKVGLTAGVAASLILGACSSDDASKEDTVGKGQEVDLSYVAWDTEIASTNVLGAVLEDLGYDVKLTQLDNAITWESVANGESDAMVSAWLPGTHESQYAKYKDDLDDLGENLEGAKIGMAVPKYMDKVDSIKDLTDEADKKITGIEPGAGVVNATEKAVENYANLDGWEVQTSSSGAMITALGQAISNEEDIVFTGWSPHWMFQTYDLKYLDDPDNIYGEEETINTMARKGLKDDMPEAYKVIDAFHWESDDIESVMLDISEGADPEDAAKDWVKDNQDKVSEWTKGVEKE